MFDIVLIVRSHALLSHTLWIQMHSLWIFCFSSEAMLGLTPLCVKLSQGHNPRPSDCSGRYSAPQAGTRDPRGNPLRPFGRLHPAPRAFGRMLAIFPTRRVDTSHPGSNGGFGHMLPRRKEAHAKEAKYGVGAGVRYRRWAGRTPSPIITVKFKNTNGSLVARKMSLKQELVSHTR
jgi:hypothetical protein